MAQSMVRIRMLRQIDQQRVVLELAMGQHYDLPTELAEQLIQAGACERVTPMSATPRLEAAAQAAPSRRG